MESETESFLGVRPNSVMPKPNGFRYPALEIIIGVYRILAAFIGVATLVLIMVGIYKFDNFGNPAAVYLVILVAFISGFFGVVSCLAVAEIIRVFLDIEKNTRNAAT